jgi:hypothetical protein
MTPQPGKQRLQRIEQSNDIAATIAPTLWFTLKPCILPASASHRLARILAGSQE